MTPSSLFLRTLNLTPLSQYAISLRFEAYLDSQWDEEDQRAAVTGLERACKSFSKTKPLPLPSRLKVATVLSTLSAAKYATRLSPSNIAARLLLLRLISLVILYLHRNRFTFFSSLRTYALLFFFFFQRKKEKRKKFGKRKKKKKNQITQLHV